MEERVKAMEEEKATADTQEAGSGGKFSEMSPKEIEELMGKTREELEVAKAKKNFVKCIELQVRSFHDTFAIGWCSFRVDAFICRRRSEGGAPAVTGVGTLSYT